MIFVTLGTQDKSFKRLLNAVEKFKREGIIKEKVIVQAGCTKFKSDILEVFDLLPIEKFNELLLKADLVITHGGVGSILTALQNGKKVIAVPRLSKYKEHTNDHQLQIVTVFAEEKYLLSLTDLSKLGEVYEASKTFKPRKYKSNHLKFQKAIDSYLKEEHRSWLNRILSKFTKE